MNSKMQKLANEYRRQIWEEVFSDIGQSVVAVVLYTLYCRGWHKDKLVKLFYDVRDMLNMPPIFGRHQMTTNECIEFLEKKLDVSFEELNFRLETKAEERARERKEREKK